MPPHTPRTYHSKLRERQAAATRERIVATAETLFVERGYEKTTITAIAADAHVAPQTVYATFGSKVGLVSAVIDRIRRDESYLTLQQEALQAEDPRTSLRIVACLVGQIYDSRARLFEQILGTLASSPDLTKDLEAQYIHDRKLSRIYMSRLYERGVIRADLDLEKALDIFWVLISFAPYQLLVRYRRWTSQAYTDWLADLLCRELLNAPEGQTSSMD